MQEELARVAVSEELLLDRNGRPLRGAARASRIRKIERERSLALAAGPAPLAPPPVAVAEPALPAVAAVPARWAARLRVPRVAIPRVPVPRLPMPSLSLRAMRLIAITSVMTFVFATAIGTTGIVAQHGTIAFGASTTLSVIRGEVEVSASPGAPFVSASDGELLRAGMTVRTSPDAYAVLTYFEGSTVSLDPGTTLVITSLAADPDGSTTISMDQLLGKTWHSVSKLVNAGSKYEVRTPTAVATVRGTMFEVDVASQQDEIVSTVKTTEGAVATSKAPTVQEPAPAQVVVTPGNQVTVRPSAPLPAPVPQPEPERTVTVAVAAPAGLVLDPAGRANGVKDGKVIAQTPGAQVRTVNGQVVVTFKDPPDGRISTVVGGQRIDNEDAVKVSTVVRERGAAEKRSEAEVRAPAAPEPAASPSAATDRTPPPAVASPDRGPAKPSQADVSKSDRRGDAVATVEVRRGEDVAVKEVRGKERDQIVAQVKVAKAPEVKRDETERIFSSTLPPLPVGAKERSGPSGRSEQAAKAQPQEEQPQRAQEKSDQQRSERARGDGGSSAQAPKAEAAKAEARPVIPSFALPSIPGAGGSEHKRAEPQEVRKDEPKPQERATQAEPPKQREPQAQPAKQEEPRAQETERPEPQAEPPKDERKPEPRFELPKLELPDIRFGRAPQGDKGIGSGGGIGERGGRGGGRP